MRTFLKRDMKCKTVPGILYKEHPNKYTSSSTPIGENHQIVKCTIAGELQFPSKVLNSLFSTRIFKIVLKSNISKSKMLYNDHKFERACMGRGAQISVYNLYQAKAYCTKRHIPFRLQTSPSSYKFDDGARKIPGNINMRVPISESAFVSLYIDSVDADVPLLLGLEYRDEHVLVADIVHCSLFSKQGTCQLPIIRTHGHIF